MEEKTIAQDNLCLRCGGQMRFDPQMQMLVCAVCGEAPEQGQEQGQTTAATDSNLDCPNCGAELTVITGIRQAKCDSCDSTFNMLSDSEDCTLTGEIPDDHKYIAPFAVSKEDYQKGMISWLVEEKLTPVDVFDKIAMIRSEGCYVPYYYCIANYKVQWTASIGYDRIETYIVHIRQKGPDGRIRTVPVTRTRVVTDWRPYAASAAGRVTNLCDASNYIRKLESGTRAANSKELLVGINESSQGLFDPIGDIQIDRKHPFDTKYTAGFEVLPCDEPAAKVYDRGKINAGIRRDIERSAPGDRIRDLNFHGDIVPDYFMVYLPRWATVYSYGDKVCFNTCDGTDANKHFGTRPIDKDKKRRIRKWFLLSLAPLALAVAMLVALFVGDGAMGDALWSTVRVLTIVFWVLTAATLLLALIMRALILRKSKKGRTQQSESYMANPSAIFGRKSAKSDPLNN